MYQLLDSWVSPTIENSYGIHIFLLLVCIVGGFYLLIKGGDWLSDHSANLAFQLGIPPVVVGLTVVSIATSTPELFTSISALNSDSPGLILGNIIGSNIANIALILGIALLIGTVPTKDAVSNSQRICLFGLTISFCGFLLFSPNHEIGFTAGTVFLLFIAAYLLILTTKAIRQNQSQKAEAGIEINQEERHTSPLLSLGMLLVATFALWAGADSLVYGSKGLAEIGGIPEELIGFTLLAIGTSLPELAASISLVRKQRSAMLLGNIVGSNLFNISLVGGLAGVLGPVRSSAPYAWIDYLFLLLTTMLLVYWLKGKILGKKEGALLLLTYAIATMATWVLNS
jgi:cation:H+ antiporter